MQKRVINILFLGAAKRVELLESFLLAASQMHQAIKLFSCELEEGFYPISHLATILSGPSFHNHSKFIEWLKISNAYHKFDIIIPTLDSATVVLSKIKSENLLPSLAHYIVSDFSLCEVMFNKNLASDWFSRHGLPQPCNQAYPKICKPATGSAAKGQAIFHSLEEEQSFFKSSKRSDYIIQEFIKGKESTVDLYFSLGGKFIGYVIRDRLEVSDGEVMSCQTRFATSAESKIIKAIAQQKGWRGCITLQYIRNKSEIYIIEINPRFGGGAPCAIAAGLEMPYYILNEVINNIEPIEKRSYKLLKMVRARKSFYKEII